MNIRIKLQLIFAFCAAALANAWAAPVDTIPTYATTMQSAKADELLNNVGLGQNLKIQDVWLEGAVLPVTLVLERFDVFGPEARIIVHHRQRREVLKPPGSAYFRGGIEGALDSIAVLSANAAGEMRGIVQTSERLWVLGGTTLAREGTRRAGLVSRELQQDRVAEVAKPFRCDVDRLPQAVRSRALPVQQDVAPLPPGQSYEVPVAIETDAEFYNRFGNWSDASSYIGNLFAYASSIYLREASAELTVNLVNLWAGGVNSDPWDPSSPYEGLTSFQSYWNANRKNDTRAIAHFLSGRDLGGGIAYVGVLCDKSNGYGFSANISGNFSIDNPHTVWDILVVTHEIGHNFDSLHTHDYGGVDGPVDACYKNGAPAALPALGSLSGGMPGTGVGTIMSYCHLISPGYSNISMTFGQNHPYGVKAYRVSDVIRNYVAQVAAAYPSCIGLGSSQTYSLSVVKSGSGAVASSPVGIDCGTNCSAPFRDGALVTLTATPASGYQFASWSGDCTGQSSASCTVQMTDNRSATAQFKIASSISLIASTTVPKYGEDVTFTATITGGASSGTVTFKDGTETLGSGTLTGGKGVFTISSLTVGTHTILAAYSGDDSHAGSTGGLSINVAKRGSTTTLGGSPAAPKYGDAITLTATVNGKSPTGIVTFKDGGTVIGNGTLVGGLAAMEISTLAVGSHSISAAFGGDSNHTASSGSLSGFSIGKLASTTALDVSSSAPKFGDRISLTATVSGKSPTGTITFRDGATTLGTVTVSGARATMNVASLTVGSHSVSASYSGDIKHTASNSGTVNVTVEKAATTTALFASATTTNFGTNINFTATVTGVSPTGTITFKDDVASLGTVALTQGKATLNTNNIAVGNHHVTAEYSGDARNAASVSIAVAETVNKAPTTMTLSSSSASPKYGDSVTLTATVTGKAPSGTVAFAAGATALGTGALSNGKASLTVTSLAVGAHAIIASYGGDSNLTASTSTGLGISVGKRGSTIALGVSPVAPKSGDAVTVTATVSGKSPAGTVTFKDGATVIGDGILANGQAAMVVTNLSVGSHSISASYGGDVNHTNSSSSAVGVTIGKLASTAALAVSSTTPQYGEGIVFTATVEGVSPNGSVTFRDGASTLGTGSLTGGQAMLPTSSLTVGIHSVTASYGGDARHLSSTSGAIGVTVGKAGSSTLLTPSATTSPYGAKLVLTVQVLGKSPTGTTTFREGATVLGTKTLSGGRTALSIGNLAVGSHEVTAAYSGDKNHSSSASAAVAVTVTERGAIQ